MKRKRTFWLFTFVYALFLLWAFPGVFPCILGVIQFGECSSQQAQELGMFLLFVTVIPTVLFASQGDYKR